MKLTLDEIRVVRRMRERGAAVTHLAKDLGVTEGAVRYRLKRLEEGDRLDGRAGQATALDGYEEAVEAIQERLGDRRLRGEGRPCQVRLIYEALVRDHGYAGSYQSVVRHLRRKHGKPRVRAIRRVETPPGIQAQHDWFEERVPIGRRVLDLALMLGVLSYSRARFCWPSEDQTQLSWHTGHHALFTRYEGVPPWVRIDNPKTAVARGAGPTAVLNRSYAAFARTFGFEVDACRAGKGSDKGKVERSVRTLRESFGEVLRRGAGDLEELGRLLDARSEALLDRLRCPVTGGTVREALADERLVLQPLPSSAELFDVEVTRPVSRDCLVSFEGRRYSVPFAWVGRLVDVRGTARDVVVRGGGEEIARHRRGTRALLLLDESHYDGPSTDRVIRPTPLGRRGRLQVAGVPAERERAASALAPQEGLERPLSEYARLVELLG